MEGAKTMTKFFTNSRYWTLAYVLLVLIASAGMARAQEGVSRMKVYAGYSTLKPEYNDDYIHGVELEATPKILSYERVRLEATASLAGHFTTGGNNLQFMAGPQLSINLAHGRITPFVRALFGTTYVYDTHIYTQSVGGGVDVNLGNYFVRPFQFDRQWLKGLYPITANRFGSGAGVRF